MRPTAGYRKEFSKLGRSRSTKNTAQQAGNSARVDSDMSQGNGQPGGDSADERTPLVTNTASSLGNMGSLQHITANDGGKPLYKDERRWVRWPMNFLHLTWQTLSSNYVNILLVFVPAGIILGAMDLNPTAVFVVNFLAIVPLAALLSFATEELSAKLGQTIGGLMNATFGNAVELIVCLFEFVNKMDKLLTNCIRSRLLPSPKARFALSSLACWAAFSPTSCSSLAAASSPLEFAVTSLDSMRPSRAPCPR